MSAQPILKWGNSLAFRIPSAIAKQMDIHEGAEVAFHIDGKLLVIEKATRFQSLPITTWSTHCAKRKKA
jgi:antitoxin component of MazEF toxin-antitoxin module